MLPELVPLPLLGLGDLGHHQLLPGQLLQQLLQDLPVVEVFLDVLHDGLMEGLKKNTKERKTHLHDDPLRVQLVIDPLDQDAEYRVKIDYNIAKSLIVDKSHYSLVSPIWAG